MKKINNNPLIEKKEIFNMFNVWLTVELTNICNLRCTMCNIREYDPLSPGMMDIDIFKKLMEELVEEDIRIFGLKLFWLGEPLLHPQFSEILRLIPSKQVNDTIVFDTNCQMLDREISDAIIERCRDSKVYIFLSLDGINDSTYESMRCGGNRKRAYDNIHYLLRRRKEENLIFPKMRIQFIVHENNYQEVEEFIEYWRGFDYWEELPVMDSIEDDRDFIHLRRWITGEKQAEADRLYEKVLKKLNIKKEDMPANIDLRNCDAKDFPCENLWAMPMIRSNGDVTVCNNDVELSLKVGNIEKNSFLSVWTGENIEKLRRLHLENRRDEIEKCKNCDSGQRTYFPENMEKLKNQIYRG